MKASTIIISLSALASGALAGPTMRYGKRQGGPSQQDTINAINSWNNDVNNVNTFLNNAPGQSAGDVELAAQEALLNANDEPVQLGILASIPGLSDDATQAVTLLKETFGNVPTSLQNIIDGGDKDNNLNTINHTRCCNVLPALDVLWTAAATDEGVANQVNLVVPRPTACTDGTVIC
jgi:hypothetical protein